MSAAPIDRVVGLPTDLHAEPEDLRKLGDFLEFPRRVFISLIREEEILEILTLFLHHTAATFPLSAKRQSTGRFTESSQTQVYASKPASSIEKEHQSTIIEKLGVELRGWAAALPSQRQTFSESPDDIAFFHKLSLARITLLYHNTVISLYQAGLFHRATPLDTGSPDFEDMAKRHRAWLALCMKSARITAQMVKVFPAEHSPGVRSLIELAVAAYMALFKCILDDPRAATVQEDPDSMHTIFEFLSDLMEQASKRVNHKRLGFILPLIKVCIGCEELVRKAIRD
ncbi:hypothetical protein BDV12DRAFT_195964 [Aspergillus spectabilis]